MNHFLDASGLTYLWSKIKSVFATKADTVWNKSQTLSSAQKTQARTNIGAQETLVSGINIKTVNNESLLGSGNITIQGGGSTITFRQW